MNRFEKEMIAKHNQSWHPEGRRQWRIQFREENRISSVEQTYYNYMLLREKSLTHVITKAFDDHEKGLIRSYGDGEYQQFYSSNHTDLPF